MPTAYWSGEYKGNSAGTGDRSCHCSGDAIPSTATINSVSVALNLSADGYSSSKKWRVSYFHSGGTYFIGDGDTSNYPYTESMGSNDEWIYFDFTKNLSFFKGKSGCTLVGRANTSHSSTSYMWDIELTINYTSVVTPTAPTINYPAAANRITYNTKPWFRFKANTNTNKLYWRVDSGSWKNFTANNGNSYDKQWTTVLTPGSHTISCYSQSSTSTNSSTVSRTFTIAEPQSAVTAGSLLDDNIIDGLQTNIKNQQSYYGKTQTSFTVCDLGSTILSNQINEMVEALVDLPHTESLSEIKIGDIINASTINNIRSALLKS